MKLQWLLGFIGCFFMTFYSSSGFAAQNLKNLEVNFDNYYAKISVHGDAARGKAAGKKTIVEYEDPYSSKSVELSKCSRRAWNSLVSELTTEVKDYELLINTNPPPKTATDISFKHNGHPMTVASSTSLGNWSRNIEAHWKDFAGTCRENH